MGEREAPGRLKGARNKISNHPFYFWSLIYRMSVQTRPPVASDCAANPKIDYSDYSEAGEEEKKGKKTPLGSLWVRQTDTPVPLCCSFCRYAKKLAPSSMSSWLSISPQTNHGGALRCHVLLEGLFKDRYIKKKSDQTQLYTTEG